MWMDRQMDRQTDKTRTNEQTVLNLHQKTDPKVQQDFIGQGHYGKVKSRSYHDVAHLHPLTNVPTKYQLPKPYGF